jgi:ABC-type Zn uptake system ZnuABC Zn-binding protein ZnuA
MTRLSTTLRTVITVTVLAACTSTPATSDSGNGSARPVVVATSAIAADFVQRLAGDTVELVVLVPNAVDTHTYEPKASELRSLDSAVLVVIPDSDLNPEITQIAELTVGRENIVDLNASSLAEQDYIYREPAAQRGRNVHTWTDPSLAAKWVDPLAAALVLRFPKQRDNILAAATELNAELAKLDVEIRNAINTLPLPARKLVVYHDAWEYFGRHYDVAVVGALQAVDFSEPSAAEIAAMADQIRNEQVRAFFGSEVFPSAIMETLEDESGARYVPDLADDALPGQPGAAEHTYLGMMRRNIALMVENLRL